MAKKIFAVVYWGWVVLGLVLAYGAGENLWSGNYVWGWIIISCTAFFFAWERMKN